MRCFVAVDIDENLKDKIINIQKELATLGNMKLVEKQNLHFTLKFLGEINERTIKEVMNKLESIAKQTQSFTINIQGMGAFPSLDYIRVVWIGADESRRAL